MLRRTTISTRNLFTAQKPTQLSIDTKAIEALESKHWYLIYDLKHAFGGRMAIIEDYLTKNPSQTFEATLAAIKHVRGEDRFNLLKHSQSSVMTYEQVSALFDRCFNRGQHENLADRVRFIKLFSSHITHDKKSDFLARFNESQRHAVTQCLHDLQVKPTLRLT